MQLGHDLAIGERDVSHTCSGVGLDGRCINGISLDGVQSRRAPTLAARRAGPRRAGRERVGSHRLVECVTERAQWGHNTHHTPSGQSALCNGGHRATGHIDQAMGLMQCLTAVFADAERAVTLAVRSVVVLALVFTSANTDTYAQDWSATSAETARGAGPWRLDQAQRAFYNARYEIAAAATRGACAAGADSLAACELRTAALLFQIRGALGTSPNKDKAWKQCAVCPQLMSEFEAALAQGQALARAQLQTHPDDHATLFLLGKMDLTYVWLQLGTLGRRTGWGEYWEGRRALDRVLKFEPNHVRARVARGWIDYIVDTKMPRGTRWLLGGGNKKRGLRAVREAAGMEADFFTRAEARFALWDMQIRERDVGQAVITARDLARDFPENEELNRFIQAHDPSLPQ